MQTQLRTYAATHIQNNKPTNRDTYYIHMLYIYTHYVLYYNMFL